MIFSLSKLWNNSNKACNSLPKQMSALTVVNEWVSELTLLIVVQINRQEWTRIPCSGPEINDEEGTISTIHHTLLQILQAIYWSVETVKKISFKLSYLISWGDQAVILLKTLIKSLQYHFACMMNYCHQMTVISTIDDNFYTIFNQFL